MAEGSFTWSYFTQMISVTFFFSYWLCLCKEHANGHSIHCSLCLWKCVWASEMVQERDKERRIDRGERYDSPVSVVRDSAIMQMSMLNAVGRHPACH